MLIKNAHHLATRRRRRKHVSEVKSEKELVNFTIGQTNQKSEHIESPLCAHTHNTRSAHRKK